MAQSPLLVAVLMAGTCVVAPNPVARADDSVTYEVVSDSVTTANLEYFDGTARRSLEGVPLPWRTEVAMANARSWATDGAEIRADWRSSITAPVWRPGKWVTVRIYIGNQLRCQNTLDVGNAACYGSTSFNS